MDKTVILGVLLNHRTESSRQFQEILTKYGCMIKTRLGIHHVEQGQCATSGVIILDVIGKDEDINAFESELSAVQDLQLQNMTFNF